MKKGFLKVMTAGLVMASSLGFVACTPDKDDDYEYNFLNYDSTYAVNEDFSLAGAKLKITNEDGTEKEITITDDMIKSMPDMTTTGQKTVTIVYDGKEFTLTIEVLAPNVLGYQFSGYLPIYDINDQFDITNLKLNIDFDIGNDLEIPVTANMISAMPNMSVVGTKQINVTYNGENYTLSFVVKDTKAEMLSAIQDFMSNYNATSVRTSGIKINIEGTAKYLGDNAEFNEELSNITLSSLNNLDGYKIYQSAGHSPYMLIKEYTSMQELENDDTLIDLIGVEYTVLKMYDGQVKSWYGSANYDITSSMTEIDLDEFMANVFKVTQNYNDSKSITVYDSKLAQTIYKSIINAVVGSTMDVEQTDIISSRDNWATQLDLMKTFQNISTNVTNIDFYSYFINDMLLPESDALYVEFFRTMIADAFLITDQISLDALDDVLADIFDKIRNNELVAVYDLIIDLNDVIKASNGDAVIISKLDAIVSGLDTQDGHMLSKFVYDCKDFARVYDYTYGETSDFSEAISGNRECYDEYWDNDVLIYQYREEIAVADADDYIDAYYSGLKSLVEKIENIGSYADVKTFANDIITAIREMDKVVQDLDENGYESDMMNFRFTSTIRTMLEFYVEMYDAEIIADIIDMLGQVMPEGAIQHEVQSTCMEPEIYAGDIVTVEVQATYDVGDIILLDTQDASYVHRVIGKLVDGDKTYYICHGDANRSANPANEGIADWNDDAEYIQGLISASQTIDQIKETAYCIIVVEAENIQGKITGVNESYIGLPANLVQLLQDCANTIYLAFSGSDVDYIKLLEDICDRLGLEVDDYIEQLTSGEMTIFADLFAQYVGELSQYEGAQLEFLTTLEATCAYLDSIFIEGTDRTELMNEINECLVALYNVYEEIGEGYENHLLITDILVRLTNTEQDFNTNFKDVLTEYKTIVKESSTMMLVGLFNIAENDVACEALGVIVDSHLTAYLNNEFVIGDFVADMNEFIDAYCTEDVRTYVKSFTILSTLLANGEQGIDYNELFGSIDLPDEIKDVDFNKLIKETLRDTETYDILELQDVRVDYITDGEGNITKEILTISLNANYDILLSSMDAKITLTIEINF